VRATCSSYPALVTALLEGTAPGMDPLPAGRVQRDGLEQRSHRGDADAAAEEEDGVTRPAAGRHRS
jgi:hypothetical protein